MACIYIYYTGSVYRDGDVHLVGGSRAWEGRVEIFFGSWGTIHEISQYAKVAQVVCRQLGYDTLCETVMHF